MTMPRRACHACIVVVALSGFAGIGQLVACAESDSSAPPDADDASVSKDKGRIATDKRRLNRGFNVSSGGGHGGGSPTAGQARMGLPTGGTSPGAQSLSAHIAGARVYL